MSKSKGEVGTIEIPTFLKTEDTTEVYLNGEINEYKRYTGKNQNNQTIF
jgi:hypothetical protein